MVEASDRNQRRTSPLDAEATNYGMRGIDAGLAATAANARRLMLTHFWPDNDREMTRIAAAGAYDGEILVAEESLQVSLG